MCRYAEHRYKEPFACFECRKSFKQPSRWDLPSHLRPKPGEGRVIPCPQCGKPLADMGRDFKAPKAADLEQWEKVRRLVEAGFSFHSCGCCGPGLRPAELREVEAFIQSRARLSEGERLLRSIRERLGEQGNS